MLYERAKRLVLSNLYLIANSNRFKPGLNDNFAGLRITLKHNFGKINVLNDTGLHYCLNNKLTGRNMMCMHMFIVLHSL